MRHRRGASQRQAKGSPPAPPAWAWPLHLSSSLPSGPRPLMGPAHPQGPDGGGTVRAVHPKDGPGPWHRCPSRQWSPPRGLRRRGQWLCWPQQRCPSPRQPCVVLGTGGPVERPVGPCGAWARGRGRPVDCVWWLWQGMWRVRGSQGWGWQGCGVGRRTPRSGRSLQHQQQPGGQIGWVSMDPPGHSTWVRRIPGPHSSSLNPEKK
mmetsp:Transcript_69592/g.122797  ORF Transcript_69592/g.122797 Transcript_69592/m.122797 type:complete len:206 (+) Transcript_69592:2463-3080(+)